MFTTLLNPVILKGNPRNTMERFWVVIFEGHPAFVLGYHVHVRKQYLKEHLSSLKPNCASKGEIIEEGIVFCQNSH